MTDRTVSSFAAELRQRFGVERVLLFGSRARGTATADSDVDLIVVSPSFSGQSRRERPVPLYRVWYEAGGDAPVDLICLTPDEFTEAVARVSLVRSVLPEAIEFLHGNGEGPVADAPDG